MIVFDLQCDQGHRFEGWFGSSSDYESQCERGLVTCPECGSSAVDKAVMAPAVGAKGNTRPDHHGAAPDQGAQEIAPVPQPVPAPDAKPVSNKPMPAEMEKALKALATAQQKALEKSTWVGKDFAAQSRAMHYGESDEKPIHGQASLEEAQSLAEEGVQVAALPFPVAPPDKLN
ncbi:MAG: DUF1178 family protein [Erythrobacter sp.]